MNSYLIIDVKGKNIDRFLHKCIKNNINIINIKNISHKEIIIKINEKDYNNLLKIKSIYKLDIIDSRGILKFKELFNKNKILIIMGILGITFLIILTNTIFSIQIESDNSMLNKKVNTILNSYGIKKYSFKKGYKDIQKIKKEILDKYKDEIEWIEITDIGTKIEVKIVERKKNKIIEDESYTNVIASKSGIIRKIEASSGIKQIELNTYVNKGDIIISGTILKGEDIKGYVHSKGKVYAEVWYDVNIEFPLNYTEKIYTSNTKKSFYIKLNNKYIENKKFKSFERKKIKSLENKLLPFEIGIENQREVRIINDKYSIKEAKRKALEKAKEKVLQTLDKDEYIIDEKVLNFIKKDSKIVLDIFFSCYEEIGKEEKIIQE